ncbi:MAG: hypothetical protein JO112_19430, partial [Planctomycetes bacterium]|nr:hypothetical protein [Planctomycetota bacterium]
MIVFGDPQRTESSRDFLTSLREEAANLAAFAPGIARVTAGTRLLVEAGELTQGLLDAAFALRGEDDWADREKACAALLLAAASLWESTQDEAGATAPFLQALEDLACLPLPDTVTVQVPEGYAFYALYPDLSARAAQQILAQ